MAVGIDRDASVAPAAGVRSSLRQRLKSIRDLAGMAFVSPMMIPFSLSSEKEMILSDVRRWVELEELEMSSDTAALLYVLCFFKEFRALYYYRLKQGGVLATVLVVLFKVIYRQPSWLVVRPKRLGPGFFISHGVGTNVNGESIGANCRVNQQVTIGFRSGPRLPRIGDNVQIAAGARVLGDLTVGDNVIIGANAVVTKDVPPNCTVVGVPAYIVKRDGVRVREEL